MNERYCLTNFAMLLLLQERGKPEAVMDTFKEFHFRTLSRDFEHIYEKALEVLKLDKTLDEVKKFI